MGQLRDKYAYAIQTCKGKFIGNAEERDGKLYFKGTVATEDQKNEIWNAIKTIPDWQKEVVADISLSGGAPASTGSQRTHTVKAGETLSKIAKDELGSAGAYMKIFEANKDQLQDPNMIKPGQVLRIPA
jgi:nucleoid-associated protein YgaU